MGQNSFVNIQPLKIKPPQPKSSDFIEIGAQFDNVTLLDDRGKQKQHHAEKFHSLSDMNTIIIEIAYHSSSKQIEEKGETWSGCGTLDESLTSRSSGETWSTVGYSARLEERKLSSQTGMDAYKCLLEKAVAVKQA